MAEKTGIAWTDHTFNPWMGCHKVSQGCTHCYAETLVTGRMGQASTWGANGVRKRTVGPWRKVDAWHRAAAAERVVKRVFCASLADVFEDYEGPNLWRDDVWDLVRRTPWFDWQILTKRPENIERMTPDDWGDGYPNVWLGASIEDNRVIERGPILTAVPAWVHFVSYEPAIGPLDQLDLAGIEWMIVGGESGPGYRPMDLDWARDMRRRCADREERPCLECGGAGWTAHPPVVDPERRLCTACGGDGVDPVAFFFKQSAAPRTEMGIDALGEIVRNYPRSWDRRERVHPSIEAPLADTTASMF